MARIPMVTRTIQTTKANVLCLNIVEGEPFNEVVTLPRTYKDEKSLMKMVEKAINTDSVKAVHVVDTKVEETLYGMSEADFIVNAKILPKREPQADAPTDETNWLQRKNYLLLQGAVRTGSRGYQGHHQRRAP